MAPNDILVTAPTPTINPKAYRHSGRGGAGNMYRPSATATASSTSSLASAPSPVAAPKPKRFYSGVGGAGNVHAADERPPLSFEEEINRARARERSGVGHVGIGGAGNVFGKKKKSKGSSPSSAEAAAATEEKDEEGAKGEDEKARRGSLWSLSSFESVLMKPVKAS